jgi:hypothetical protein
LTWSRFAGANFGAGLDALHVWPVRFDHVAVDPDSDAVTARNDYADWSLLAKLSALGVQAHMGLPIVDSPASGHGARRLYGVETSGPRFFTP